MGFDTDTYLSVGLCFRIKFILSQQMLYKLILNFEGKIEN